MYVCIYKDVHYISRVMSRDVQFFRGIHECCLEIPGQSINQSINLDISNAQAN